MAVKKAFVTGGAGFIGSALVHRLLNEGWQVLVYDNLSTGKADFLPQSNHNLDLMVGDILDREALVKAMSSFTPDIVFHLAAIHYIPYCNAHPLETLRVNVEGTASVLESCKVSRPPRLVFASTAAVYPAQDGLLQETITPAPLDIYGESKYFGEQLVKRFHQQSDTTCIIARLFNVYGPRETNPHLIPELMEQLMRGMSKLNLGNLEPKRDYVYVEDMAQALYGLGIMHVTDPKTLVCVNIATGKEYSVAEVLHILQGVVNQTIHITQDPAKMRPSDRPHLCGDVSRLRSLLGWAPSTDLETGLQQLFEWSLSSQIS